MENENYSISDKEYGFIKPDIHKIGSITDNCIRDCHYKFIHIFQYRCIYDFYFTNITKN